MRILNGFKILCLFFILLSMTGISVGFAQDGNLEYEPFFDNKELNFPVFVRQTKDKIYIAGYSFNLFPPYQSVTFVTYDLSTQEQKVINTRIEFSVYDFAVSPRGDMVAVGTIGGPSDRKGVVIIQPADLSTPFIQIMAQDAFEVDLFTSVAVSPEGDKFVTGGFKSRVVNGKPIQTGGGYLPDILFRWSITRCIRYG